MADERALKEMKAGEVKIAFPSANIDIRTDGISHLLCMLMGGQADIDIIERCNLMDLQFPARVQDQFLGPKYGIDGIREYTGVTNGKPLLGGILKPKTGVGPAVMLDMVKELVDGGVNFIKEDEILASPYFCRIEDRLPKIARYLDSTDVIYCAAINADPAHILRRAMLVSDIGINGVHVNFWAGMGVYKSIRELDLPLFLHFQKSGDKILTNTHHQFSIHFSVVVQLAGLSGVDFIHAGMIGGYYKWGNAETLGAVDMAHTFNVLPALSCGFHPGAVDMVTETVGPDYLANVGGAIHGHPGGTLAGARAMRQAIDKDYQHEYQQAIEKWGKENKTL
jgi:ribulose-bisphosphate carboxylase large chain